MVHYTSALMGFLAVASTTFAASLTRVTNFGPNPNNVMMNIYVPDKVLANPPLILAMHYCSGTAQAYYQNTKWARLADSLGFIVLYPEAPRSVSKATSLHHS